VFYFSPLVPLSLVVQRRMTNMKKFSFIPEPIIVEQLDELSRITQRPVSDLINGILAPALDQMVEDQDTDYMQLVLEGVVYSNHAQAKLVAENCNAFNRTRVREHGRFYVRTAFVTDDCKVEFTELALLEA
jgi:hypothetical protein